MTAALNFTTKAIANLHALATQMCREDAAGVRFLATLLQRAEVFVLPDAGELLDRSKSGPEVPGIVYRPPFPVTVCEYQTADRGSRCSIYEVEPSPQRISLAWEWDGCGPFGEVIGENPAAGEAVAIASICYFPNSRQWVPVGAAILIPFDCVYGPVDLGPHHLAFLESGRLKAKQVAAPALKGAGFVPLLPGWMAQVAAQIGAGNLLDTFNSDLMDEVNAYRDLCITLSCNNVSAERVGQPPRLNRARIKAGKPPLKDFHVLTIAGRDSGEGGALGGVQGGVRSHLRRGHVRRLGSERITWVNACMVRGSRPGFSDKAYRVQVPADRISLGHGRQVADQLHASSIGEKP